jgi:hypothetical protein
VYNFLPEKIKPLAKRIYKRRRGNHQKKSEENVEEVFKRAYKLMDSISVSDPVIVDAGANVGEVTEIFWSNIHLQQFTL